MAQYDYARLGYSASYRLTDDSLVCEVRQTFRSQQISIPLDQVPQRPRVVSTSLDVAYVLAVIMAVWLCLMLLALFASAFVTPGVTAGVVGTAAFVVSVLVATFVWRQGRRHITYFDVSSGTFGLHAPANPWPPLAEFLKSLEAAKVEALKRKLRILSLAVEQDEVTRYLLWLRDSGIVGDSGLLALHEDLEASRRRGPTGFGLSGGSDPAS